MPTITVIQPTITEEKSVLKRVAAYCRVSSDSEDQLHSFAAQMRHYTQAFSGSAKENLVDVYADEGISGVTTAKRTEFQRMLKDCRSGKIDRIVTKSISRFARNTKECLETVRELRSLGVTIHFEKEGIDTANTADEFMITLMGGLAQDESVSISQNMQWAIEKPMQNGTFTAAHAPYGYVKIGNALQINETEAQVVRQIFQLFLSGEGILSICRILNDQQINRQSKSGIWRKETVRYILSNEAYIGDSLWRKKYTANQFPFQKRENHGEIPQYYCKNHHPAIVNEATFEAAQKLIAEKSYDREKPEKYPLTCKIECADCGTKWMRCVRRGKVYWVCRKHKERAADCAMKPVPEQAFFDAYALSELLICGKCGTPYRRTTWANRGKKQIVWRCISRLEHGKKYCSESPTIKEENLHRAILKAVNEYFGCSEELAEILKMNIGSVLECQGQQKILKMRERLRELDAQRNDLVMMIADGTCSEDTLDTEFAKIFAEEQELNAQLQAFEIPTDMQEKIDSAMQNISKEKFQLEMFDDIIIRKVLDCVKVLSKTELLVVFKGNAAVNVVIEA